MNSPKYHDPYFGNILVQPLGPILARDEAIARLTYLPPPPRNIGGTPKHVRMHHVIQLRDFHVASLEGARVQQTIDLMVRSSYRYRDPQAPSTWSVIGGEATHHKTPRAPAMASVVVGHSGTGKTEAILRSFRTYPHQIVEHESFPNLVGKHYQVVWQSIDVPASGRADDLAANLMISFDTTMQKHVPGWKDRFATTLERTRRRDGQKMLDEWRQVAIGHFLGILHLDEVQNFFKLPTLRARRTKSAQPSELQLSIIEDQCLKWILTLINTWQIPIVLSGTPYGVGALMKRMANIQRFGSGGYHPFPNFEDPTDNLFLDKDDGGFLLMLGMYQYVRKPLAITPEFAKLIVELTGGIHRLIISLWVAAHRVAFERQEDDLRIEDFKRAAATYLAPIAPAVAALRSKDPRQTAHYEDLMRRDDNYWSTFWSSMASI